MSRYFDGDDFDSTWESRVKRLSDVKSKESVESEKHISVRKNDEEPDEDLTKCRNAAMRILAFADNSERQMREKLAEKGFSDYEAGLVIAELKEKRYIDDLRYMENEISRLARKKLYGRGRIRSELLQKFDPEIVSEHYALLIEELEEELDFPENAAILALKYPSKSREYVYAKLKNNGFTSPEVRYALEKWSEFGSSDEP